MKRLITKYPVLNLILGIIFIALGIVAIVNQTLFEEGLNYLTAAFILVFSVIIFHRDFRTYKAQAVQGTLLGAFVLTLVVVVLLIVWETMTIPKSIGLVLYLQGASHMLSFQFLNKAPQLKRFLLDLFLITLGGYLFFSEIPFIEVIQYGVIGLLILYGIMLFGFGLHKLVKNYQAKPKTVKPVKAEPKDEIIPTENKPAAVKAEQPVGKNAVDKQFSKEQLNKKNVDELKAMCKARNMTGYSSLPKSQLIERIWRYEKEKGNV